MDEKILAVALIILASGCVLPEDEEEFSSTPAQGKGLEITRFAATDNHLTPGQQAVVTLTLKNYHVEQIELNQVDIYNTGELEVLEDSTGCTQSIIRASSEGVNPEVKCTWTIEAPPSTELGDFETITYSPRLRLRYDSQMTNSKDPLQFSFKPGVEINSTQTVSKSYSNGEVQMTVEAESPVPIEGNGNIEISLSPTDVDNLISDPSQGYQIRIRPREIIEQCNGEQVIRSGNIVLFNMPYEVDKSATASCQISSPSDTQTQRNVIISTSYKYQRSPNLDIEVRSNNAQ